MNYFQNLFDHFPREALTVGVFAIVCIGAAVVAFEIILRNRIRRRRLKTISGAIEFEKFRRRKRKFSHPRIRSINPLVWVILISACMLVYGFITDQSPISPRFSLTGPVTHTRDGDTIEVNGTPVRFAKLDCAELGTPAGERAKVRMRALVRGQTINCKLTGERSYDRFIGSCYMQDGRQLSDVMVKEGYCAWWR